MRLGLAAAILGAALLLLSPAWADNEKARARSSGSDQAFVISPASLSRGMLTARDRLTVYAYFRAEFVAGRCPAGLVHKSNGCRMSGDAKRQWTLGQPLGPLVVPNSLPMALLTQLPPAPRGHRFTRIDTDIVLMDIDTRRIVEAVASVADLQDANWPVLAENDRTTLVSYYRADYANRTCPSDLIATARGCETRPLWTLGEPLDPLATYELLPERLLTQLGPAPDGYRYIRVADHILLMVTATRIIRADVVDLSDLGDRR